MTSCMNCVHKRLMAGALAAATVLTLGMASAAVEEELLLPASAPPLSLSEVQESVDYLITMYGVSEAEALRRLEVQRSVPVLAEALAERFPDEYAGIWLDQEDGGVLVVSTTQPDRLADLEYRVPQYMRLRLAEARWSYRQLIETADRVKARLGSDELAQSTVVVDEERNLVISYIRDGQDAQRQAVTSEALSEAVAAEEGQVVTEPLVLGITKEGVITSSQGPAVRVPPPEELCPRMLCESPPMRGGMRINVPRDDGTTGGCTNGFNVEGTGKSNDGWRYTLVAGHCVLGENHHQIEYTNHNGIPVGYQGGPAFPNYPHDFAIMPYRWGDLATYWMSGGGDNLVLSLCQGVSQPGSACSSRNFAINGVHDYSRIQKGWIVCASGAADQHSGAPVGWWPGTRCGEVTKKDGGIRTNICARSGDSGGPLYSQIDNKAYGILSHGSKPTPPKRRCKSDEWNSYSPVSEIITWADLVNNSMRYKIIDHP